MSFRPRTRCMVFVGCALFLGGGGGRSATIFSTLDAALATAFPGATLKREVLYPEKDALARVETLAGTDIALPIYRYRAYQGTRLVGTAYPDRHRVRTLPETVLVVVDPEGTVRDVRVLAFAEPEEYLPGSPWYAQFAGRRLDPDLRLHRGIDGVTGATLTARATTQCVRRALAIDRLLGATDEEAP